MHTYHTYIHIYFSTHISTAVRSCHCIWPVSSKLSREKKIPWESLLLLGSDSSRPGCCAYIDIYIYIYIYIYSGHITGAWQSVWSIVFACVAEVLYRVCHSNEACACMVYPCIYVYVVIIIVLHPGDGISTHIKLSVYVCTCVHVHDKLTASAGCKHTRTW